VAIDILSNKKAKKEDQKIHGTYNHQTKS